MSRPFVRSRREVLADLEGIAREIEDVPGAPEVAIPAIVGADIARRLRLLLAEEADRDAAPTPRTGNRVLALTEELRAWDLWANMEGGDITISCDISVSTGRAGAPAPGAVDRVTEALRRARGAS